MIQKIIDDLYPIEGYTQVGDKVKARYILKLQLSYIIMKKHTSTLPYLRKASLSSYTLICLGIFPTKRERVANGSKSSSMD